MASIAICALTFHRPLGLERLLRALDGLEVDPGDDVRVVIVDNDPDGSGREVAEGTPLRLPLRYVVEPERGIPAARNRALDEAAADDLVAFIDDDEVPDPRWLVELRAVLDRTGADAVTGPVLADLEEGGPDWVTAGRFFERPRHPDGALLDGATTSSVLLDARAVRRLGLRFDEALRLSGGSDTDFFLRLRAAGGTIAWSDRALVTETIPHSRMTARWILTRQWRRGLTFSTCLVALGAGRVRRLRRAANGALRIASAVPAAAGALRSGAGPRTAAVTGLQRACHGAGMVAGLFGVTYEEYATVHGR